MEGAALGAIGGTIAQGTASFIRAGYGKNGVIRMLFGGQGKFNSGHKYSRYIRVGFSKDGGKTVFAMRGEWVRTFKRNVKKYTGKDLKGDQDHWILGEGFGPWKKF